jgi:hypothetical protein
MSWEDPWAVDKYQHVSFASGKAARKAAGADEKARLRNWRAAAGLREFGSAGSQPTRNKAFQSATGFTNWKAKHKKSKFDFQYADLDGDNINEAVVWEDEHHTQPVAVNGWGMKGSPAKYYMANDFDDGQGGRTNYWEADARKYAPYRDSVVGPSIRATIREFGKRVVKPLYDSLLPSNPDNAERRKQFPASKFYDIVARELVGKPLDRQFIEKFGQTLVNNGKDLGNPQVMADELRKAHGRKAYKTLFEQNLVGIHDAGSNPQHPRHAEAQRIVREAMDKAHAKLVARAQGQPAGEDFLG